MKKDSYYKEEKIRTRGGSNYVVINIFEYGFPYVLDTVKVQENAESTFNDWLQLQLHKTPERMIFEKLLVSVDILYEAKASLSHSLHLLYHDTNLSEDTASEKTTYLVYERSLIIETAMTYITIFVQQLNYADIENLMDTNNFECDPILHTNSHEIIERLLSTIKLLKTT